jgi:hypothetical protein
MKKTRLLEIIREEISAALRESETIDLPGDPNKLNPKAKEIAIKQARNMSKDMTIGTPKNPVEFVEGDQLNEDLLMEAPFIGGSLDFAYIDGKLEKGILGKAVADATQALKKSFPDINPEAATQIITGKKSRTSEKTPSAVKDALKNIDDVIQAQADTFADERFLQDKSKSKEFSTDEQVAISNYIEKATIPNKKTGDVKRYVEKLGFPQTLNAVEKTLQGKSPVNVEPKTTTEKPELAFEKPAKETAKKEEPKAAEKINPEDKAEAMASKTPKLDKLSNNKDSLIKALRKAEKERAEVAKKRRNTEDVEEREKLLKDLKRIGQLEGELQSKIDKLF